MGKSEGGSRLGGEGDQLYHWGEGFGNARKELDATEAVGGEEGAICEEKKNSDVLGGGGRRIFLNQKG